MKKTIFILLLTILFLSFSSFVKAESGSLYLAPSSGTFLVGSTFSVSIFVDTKGNEINALEVGLDFFPDILQVTTPTARESFISEWLTPPSYSNIGGFINFKGGIKEGIVTSAGLVSTITFRAKSPGTAKVEFSDSSKILLKDGEGTPVTTTNFEGIYEILIPPPEGPKIKSTTHPDSDIWYSDSAPTFSWEKTTEMSDFSFSFSQNPQEIPDVISEGQITSISYTQVKDGIWYFHLRAQEKGIWGRTSHFGVKIDTTPPQEFETKVDLSGGFIYFSSQDLHSGMDHYEISLLDIGKNPAASPFFIESTSPYKIPTKKETKYNLIVRAFDRAGNFQVSEINFRILSPLLSYIGGKGIQIKGILFPWWLIYLLLFFSLIPFVFLIYRLLTRRRAEFKRSIKEVEEALEEIRKVETRERKEKELRKRFREKKAELEEELEGQESDGRLYTKPTKNL